MIHIAHGKLTGREITLDEDVQIPDGTRVDIQIRVSAPLTIEQRRQILDRLAGCTADDPTFEQAMIEIERQRHESRGREIDFDVAS